MADTFQISQGVPEPLGLSIEGEQANFALFSSHATQVTLGLFWDNETKEIPLNRTGDIWHVAVSDIPKNCSYAYRCVGPVEQLYNPEIWLADPYAKIPLDFTKTKVELPNEFDSEGTNPPNIALQDLIIYETHVRGFTMDPSSQVTHPGTYLGFIEKIPHLKKLGINAVEFLPIFEFDETHVGSKPFVNYWGYNTTHFFAPKKWYAHENPVNEFKTLVRELHKNGILVILDVVYNHTGEGGHKNYYINFRGIDNSVYYMTDDKGEYRDYTGCGNTFNTNHPVVQKFILDSLRYWVEEMHVDGFRFDLASIFTRDENGKPMAHPPLIEAIGKDPVLSKVKLIAEAWDAAGLYQLGCFAKWGPWSEWNGRYRDIVRRFIKGTDGKAGNFANALTGSEMIYKASKSPLASVNFITAHDGFCLKDLVTYQNKHNWENGEGNHDGSNQNDNWNCGHEGPSRNEIINAIRERQMRNFLLALFVSQGIPMLLMGDEYGHTRRGNNNPYVQDNDLNWFLWDKQDPKIVEFVSGLIALRKEHDIFRHTHFLTEKDVEWHSAWDEQSRFVAYLLKNAPDIFIAFNAKYEAATVTFPPGNWQIVINTADDWVIHKEGPSINKLDMMANSAILAVKLS